MDITFRFFLISISLVICQIVQSQQVFFNATENSVIGNQVQATLINNSTDTLYYAGYNKSEICYFIEFEKSRLNLCSCGVGLSTYALAPNSQRSIKLRTDSNIKGYSISVSFNKTGKDGFTIPLRRIRVD